MQIDLSAVLVAMLLMLAAVCVVKLLDNTPMRVQILSASSRDNNHCAHWASAVSKSSSDESSTSADRDPDEETDDVVEDEADEQEDLPDPDDEEEQVDEEDEIKA